MKLCVLFVPLFYLLGNNVEAAPAQQDPQAAASRQIKQWQRQYERNIKHTLDHRYSGCSSNNIVKRQEWGSLGKHERLDYIRAVKCLREKPALSTQAYASGARSRFDDWDATHIKVSNNVHFSGLFLHFHRYFTWLYEKALRDECGYKGSQPYWDWTIDWQDPRKSSVFNGSPYSMGSNGKSIPHGNTSISAFGISLSIPPGTGGGCIESGPFANASVNLGPVAFQPVGPDGGLGYNPRCLTRDLSLAWANQTKPSDVVKTLSSCTDLGCFDNVLEALDGIHAGGHFTIGGLGIDAFASAGDPAFFLHHSSIDRVWALWQSMDYANRTNQVYGTNTAFNRPPSPNVTLDTSLGFGILSPNKTIGDMVSTIDGPFCYMYV